MFVCLFLYYVCVSVSLPVRLLRLICWFFACVFGCLPFCSSNGRTVTRSVRLSVSSSVRLSVCLSTHGTDRPPTCTIEDLTTVTEVSLNGVPPKTARTSQCIGRRGEHQKTLDPKVRSFRRFDCFSQSGFHTRIARRKFSGHAPKKTHRWHESTVRSVMELGWRKHHKIRRTPFNLWCIFLLPTILQESHRGVVYCVIG